MKRAFFIRYQKALLACLKQGAGASPRVANRLGVEALAVGITPPALARLHENILLSIKTVEKHRGNLMQKLDIHDTAGLTRYAIGTGIIESSVQLTTI